MADCGDIWHIDEVKALGGVHNVAKMAVTAKVTFTATLCNMTILFTPITSEQRQK